MTARKVRSVVLYEKWTGDHHDYDNLWSAYKTLEEQLRQEREAKEHLLERARSGIDVTEATRPLHETIGRLEAENKFVHTMAAQWHQTWLLFATGTFETEAWKAEYERVFELAERVAQLQATIEQLKKSQGYHQATVDDLKAQLCQEREASANMERLLGSKRQEIAQLQATIEQLRKEPNPK